MLKTLFSFSGRMDRASFWVVYGPLFIATLAYMKFVFFLVDADIPGYVFGASLLPMLIITWMHYAIYAKRWHDLGKSAWWVLIQFVPVIGPFWMLFECGFRKGQEGSNEYGPDSFKAEQPA